MGRSKGWTSHRRAAKSVSILQYSVSDFVIEQEKRLFIFFSRSICFTFFFFCYYRGLCARMCSKLLCCRKKPDAESRRTSMNSKKQSIAPTIPPEDPRPRLDETLIERSSLMKAALPVLPIGLAWFCLIWNCLLPGTGEWNPLFICTLQHTPFVFYSISINFRHNFLRFILFVHRCAEIFAARLCTCPLRILCH